MGVLNVTPDSFSDGGLYATTERAVAHGLDMVGRGRRRDRRRAASRRAPGPSPVAADEELAPGGARSIEALARRTLRPGLGRHGQARRWPRRRVAAGATLVNDISASLWPGGGRAPAPAGWPCTCRASPAPCRTTPTTTTWWPRCTAFLLERARPGPRRRGARGLGRPRHRLRQDDGPQPGPAAPPARAGRRGGRRRLRRGAGGHQPQALPRRWPPGRGAGARAGWPRPPGGLAGHGPGPCWRARRWSGSTTWRPTVQAARLYGPAA